MTFLMLGLSGIKDVFAFVEVDYHPREIAIEGVPYTYDRDPEVIFGAALHTVHNISIKVYSSDNSIYAVNDPQQPGYIGALVPVLHYSGSYELLSAQYAILETAYALKIKTIRTHWKKV
jgi:hypothetical protein